MTLAFYCHSCGARFDVDARLAGKRARCKKCGQHMVIPRATELASLVAAPAVSPAAKVAAPVPTAAPATTRSWIADLDSDVALKPLSLDELQAQRLASARKPDPLDDADDSKPYALAEPRPALVALHPSGRPAGRLTVLWRSELGSIQRLLRWLNETAYLVSVPFLMMLLLGVVLRILPLAHLGATVVVLLNIGRFAVGLANLVVIPFRDGIIQGVLFLIPPFTLLYFSRHWKQLRKPTRRIVGPVATIGLVILLFTFIPWLSGGRSPSATLEQEIRDDVRELGEQVKGEVRRFEGHAPEHR